ncbi:hypothetical protein ACGFYQ_38785, partial [Streptomyces sp. NPDC048258]
VAAAPAGVVPAFAASAAVGRAVSAGARRTRSVLVPPRPASARCARVIGPGGWAGPGDRASAAAPARTGSLPDTGAEPPMGRHRPGVRGPATEAAAPHTTRTRNTRTAEETHP